MDLRYYLWTERISKTKFAEMLGVTPQTIFNYTNGRTLPRRFTARLIERLTDSKVTFEDFYPEG